MRHANVNFKGQSVIKPAYAQGLELQENIAFLLAIFVQSENFEFIPAVQSRATKTPHECKC